MSLKDLSKFLAIDQKYSWSNPQQLETKFCTLSTQIDNINSCTQSCNENKLTYVLFVELTFTFYG